jgi:flagellum-specific peptidoglycan hydrolase FlgJ
MLTREEFIKLYWPAVNELTKGTGIFPETLLGIAIIESQGKINGTWYPGQGLVARKANNYFGIKNSAQWKGQTILLPTPGDADKISSFRVYASLEDSAKDFINFLKTNPRYTNAGVFQSNDYGEQFIRIAKAGYAENPAYAVLLTKVADTFKKYVKEVNNTGKIAPLFIAALIVAGLIIAKKFT